MDCWWVVDVVADEWRTERACWEVNSSALTCEELHYASITSLTHSRFPTGAASQYWAVTISLLQTGPESWFNHSPVQTYIKQSSLAFIKSLQALWLQYRLQFDGIPVNILPFYLIPKLAITSKTQCLRKWKIFWKHIYTIVRLIYCKWSDTNKQMVSLSLSMKQEKARTWIPLHNTLVSCWEEQSVIAEATLCHCHYSQTITCLIVFTLPLHTPTAILYGLTTDWNALHNDTDDYKMPAGNTWY